MDTSRSPARTAGTGSQRDCVLDRKHVRWAIDTASSLKPFADNSYNVGAPTLRTKTYYAGTSFDITSSGA